MDNSHLSLLKAELSSALQAIANQSNSLKPKPLSENELCTLLLAALLEEEV